MRIGLVSKKYFPNNPHDLFNLINKNPRISVSYKPKGSSLIGRENFLAYFQRHETNAFACLPFVDQVILCCLFNDKKSLKKSLDSTNDFNELYIRRREILSIITQHLCADVLPMIKKHLFNDDYEDSTECFVDALHELERLDTDECDARHAKLLGMFEEFIVMTEEIGEKLDILYWTIVANANNYKLNPDSANNFVLHCLLNIMGDLHLGKNEFTSLNERQQTAKLFQVIYTSTFMSFYNSQKMHLSARGINQIPHIPLVEMNSRAYHSIRQALLNAYELLPLFRTCQSDLLKTFTLKTLFIGPSTLKNMLRLQNDVLASGLKALHPMQLYYGLYQERPDIGFLQALAGQIDFENTVVNANAQMWPDVENNIHYLLANINKALCNNLNNFPYVKNSLEKKLSQSTAIPSVPLSEHYLTLLAESTNTLVAKLKPVLWEMDKALDARKRHIEEQNEVKKPRLAFLLCTEE